MGCGQGEVGLPSPGTATPHARRQTAAPKGGQGGGAEKGHRLQLGDALFQLQLSVYPGRLRSQRGAEPSDDKGFQLREGSEGPGHHLLPCRILLTTASHLPRRRRKP